MIKRYTIIAEQEEEGGRINVTSENDGFNSLEILGIVERKKYDIISQMIGEIKPDFVKRNFIENEKQKAL